MTCMKTNPKRLGKKNRAFGKAFELKVRKDLEKQGWIVFRNSNDVKFYHSIEYDGKRMFDKVLGSIPIVKPIDYAKFEQTTGHWNPFTKSMMMSQSGFPDFLAIYKMTDDSPYIDQISGRGCIRPTWEVRFFECKGGDKNHNSLDKKEKEKVKWIEANLKIPVIIVRKGEKRGEIVYG